MSSNKVALVFGASGISGWAATKYLLSYPTPTTFSRVIGLTHRPFSIADSGLPQDPRLEVYSGINLREDLEKVKTQIQEKIPRLDEITHVYYYAYSNATAYTEYVMAIKDINTKMTYNAVHAADELFKHLEFFVLQTGTNYYGVGVYQHRDKIPLALPLREDMPRVPSPYGDEIFYYAQADMVKETAKGKSWKWCEVRPDVIIGFVPNISIMTYCEPLALFLSLYHYVNSPGATIPFPGGRKNFEHTHTESTQDIIAKAEIYLSVVKPEEANGEAFNIGDEETPASWSIKWPIITGYFGLKGVGPSEDEKLWVELDTWWNDHEKDYERMCEEFGLQRRKISPESWTFLKAVFTILDRNHEVTLQKIRSLGFVEELQVGEGHLIVFDRIAEVKVIPSREQIGSRGP